MKAHRSDLQPLIHPDPLVRQVLETWTPRFLASGIPLGELARTVERIRTWDDWAGEWFQTAELHVARGDRLATDGKLESAASAWVLASRCYHVGYHVAVRNHDLHDHGLTMMIQTHSKAVPHLKPAISTFEVGEGADRIVGLMSVPAQPVPAQPVPAQPVSAQKPAPVVISLPGLDSTKETRHGGRGPWVARGFAVLSIDGPGQGEASRWSTIRPDYEVAVSAVIDWIEQQDSLDASRIALVGMSLSGYYAPRAAAFEKRIAATVGNCGPFDWAECFDIIPAVTREAFTHYSGASSETEARELAKGLTLDGVAQKIDSPLLIVHGERDPLVPWEHGQRIVEAAGDNAEFVLVEGGNHGVNNLPFESGPVILDWVCDQLNVPCN